MASSVSHASCTRAAQGVPGRRVGGWCRSARRRQSTYVGAAWRLRGKRSCGIPAARGGCRTVTRSWLHGLPMWSRAAQSRGRTNGRVVALRGVAAQQRHWRTRWTARWWLGATGRRCRSGGDATVRGIHRGGATTFVAPRCGADGTAQRGLQGRAASAAPIRGKAEGSAVVPWLCLNLEVD
jgi:hypothetical protein